MENVVAEWAGRHGQPFRLELTGPAGGIYHAGDDAADLTLDAVEFCPHPLRARASERPVDHLGRVLTTTRRSRRRCA